jgi:hypothetical protein
VLAVNPRVFASNVRCAGSACVLFAHSALGARGERAAFAGEVCPPVEVVHAGETQVRVERILHGRGEDFVYLNDDWEGFAPERRRSSARVAAGGSSSTR